MYLVGLASSVLLAECANKTEHKPKNHATPILNPLEFSSPTLSCHKTSCFFLYKEQIGFFLYKEQIGLFFNL